MEVETMGTEALPPDLQQKIQVLSDGCWTWISYRCRGYGSTSVKGKKILAHRLVWKLLRGEVPKGKELDHLCRNRSCVNPDHLEPVTHLENVRRGRAGAPNAEKTHCPQGHEYTPENTYRRPSWAQQGLPWRECKTCLLDRAREQHRKRQEAA